LVLASLILVAVFVLALTSIALLAHRKHPGKLRVSVGLTKLASVSVEIETLPSRQGGAQVRGADDGGRRR
jgi:hypothetical protein